MNKRKLLSICLFSVAMLLTAQPRAVNDLSFGWRFLDGDLSGAEQVSLDDAQWRIVNLPHDFQIEQPWVLPEPKGKNSKSTTSANGLLLNRGFKPMVKGWYRYHLTPADSLKGRRLLLDFGGIMYVGDVYLNGEHIGGTDYGYIGFEIDVTDRLKFGQDNVIAVLADTRNANNARWYTGAGLFRRVSLIATSKDLHFERHPLYITTRNNQYVTISAEIAVHDKSKKLPVGVQIISPDGKVVYEGKSTLQRNTPSSVVEKRLPEISIPNPQLWDTEHPRLYTAIVTLYRENGSVADVVRSRFGIRTIEITTDEGLKLNGKKVLLKGYANHHALGALGAAAYPRAIEKRIQLMKQFGINHIRTAHNPYSREFIELCDQYGILVTNELYDKWTQQHTGGRVPFQQLWQHDVPEWIKRDRNSPSVVLWSLGNELQQNPDQPFNDFGVTMYKLQKALLHRYDTTRLVTVSMHPRYRSWETDSLPPDLAMITDVQAYNYRYMYFPGDGRRFPWMKFYQSEASVVLMGTNFYEMNLDKVIGIAYWGAIDYLGESLGWPAKGWNQGCFYIDLEPKPKAYLLKSMFKPEEPLVHIGILGKNNNKMWNRTPGDSLALNTYTNAEEVELVLNGKSLGRKLNPVDPKSRNQIRWNNIVYQPGYLEAIAFNNGKVVARHKIETTGEAVKLVAESDNAQWKADGMDLQHIRITAVDKKGRRVPVTTDEVTFSVEGSASIVGVINGDISSNEMTIGNKRSLFNGTCTVILRSDRTPGKVTLTATSPNLKPVTLKLQNRK